MKQFKALAVVRHPREVVWSTVRDHMAALVPHLRDVDSVVVSSRADRPDGSVQLVNEWRARAQIPALLSAVIKPEMLAWTDLAQWSPETWQCRWEIRPHFMTENVHCVGTTYYEQAMAGRGTRVVFDGRIDIAPGRMPGVATLIGGPTIRGVEAFVTSLVPKNFQKLAKAVDEHLQSASA